MRSTTIASLGIFFSLATALPASAELWTIDSQHTAAEFKIRHMMISNVKGTISGIKGTAEYDGKNIKTLKITTDLDPKSINTNEPDRDKHLRSADFFDVEKFPTMTFKSKAVEGVTPGKFKLVGDLTMHGVTKEVTLDVDGPVTGKDAHGGERLGASGTTTINRKDFGITYNHALDNGGVALGEEVAISIDIELKGAKTAEHKATETK